MLPFSRLLTAALLGLSLPLAAQQVTGLALLDADTDALIAWLTDGDTVDLSATGPRLAVQAVCHPDTVGSVVFALSGTETVDRTENTAPYALFGDAGGDFLPWEPTPGGYTLTATAWSGPNAGGSPGPGMTVGFSVVSGPGTGAWDYVPVTTFPSARHECSFVQAGDQFLLLGGRGVKPVDAYDLASGTWSPLNPTPQEIHHFQATSFHGLVYIIGAFEGAFPFENGIPFIYLYDPLTDTWFDGPAIPSARVRGSAGLVLYRDTFYVVAGITNGHTDGWVPWLDAFDPVTNAWTPLADAPRARDHFHAAVIGDKLYCAGGRRSGEGGSTFNAVVLPTDVYDFPTGTWSTLPSPAGDIPTGRAGCMAGVLDGELLVFGGESGSQFSAHDETEALDPATGNWRSLATLQRGRHGSQAIVSGDGLYVVAGSGNRGGSPELNTMEVFHFGTPTAPAGTMLTPAALGGSAPALEAAPGDTVAFQAIVEHLSGTQAGLLRGAFLSGDPAFALQGAPVFPSALPPAGQRGFDLRFTPADTGTYSATLHLVYGAFGDTLAIALSGEARSCDASAAPTGLSTSFGAGGVTFTWTPVQDAVACELQGRETGTPSFAKVRFSAPPQEIRIGAGAFQPATTYEWRVRCACSLDPLDATPLSALASFSTPAARTAGEAAGRTVAPQPATDGVELRWPSAEGPLDLRLSDLAGREVYRATVPGEAGAWRLERGDWPAGAYLMRLDGMPDGPWSRTVIWE